MEQLLVNSPQTQELILKPVLIKDVLLLSPGRWNDCDYTELEINKAYNNTDWSDRKHTSLYLDHQDTKERGVGNWVGYVKNQRLSNQSLYGDLEIWNPMIGAFLSQAKAKFGVSATLAGTENKRLSRMEDFHFESFSIVTDPACKPALINLSDTTKNLVSENVKVVTMENETKEDVVELADTAHKGSTWITYKDETGRKKHIYYDKQDKPHMGADAIETFKVENPEDVKKNSEISKEDLTLLESVKHRERRENIESVGDKKDFASALKAMMVDEKKAPGDYENLKSLCTDEANKKIIDGIIADEKRHYTLLEAMEAKKELANEGSESTVHALEPVKYNDGKELGEKFERQVQHIKDSLKKSHPEWDDKKIEQVAYATANKMKDDETSSSETRKENSENYTELKGGYKMPEIMENESIKVEELESKKPEKEAEKSKADKAEDKAEKKEEMAKEEPKSEKKEELSNEAILNKVKEMSAEELVNYTSFVKAYLSEHKDASAKEVTLAYMNKKKEEPKKELSASDLLASIDSRIATLKELDSTKEVQELKTQVKELSAKVKTPDRKTLAYDGGSTANSNLGMLGFLQHRIN